jgi:hypothetical protein
VVPLYSSEMAPARWRGGLNVLFQLGITIGIFVANMVNYMALTTHDGWRVSFAVAALPSALLATGGWLLPDTPVSLIRRGCPDQALAVLQRIRGCQHAVLPEFHDIQDAVQSEARQHPFQTILRRHNRPQLVISALLQFFQQFTGINAVMFYAPVLFHTLGYGSEAALYSAVITGAVNLVATIVSIFAVDKLGRRFFLLAGGAQMLLCQVCPFPNFFQLFFPTFSQLFPIACFWMCRWGLGFC